MKKNIANDLELLLKKSANEGQVKVINDLRKRGMLKSPSYNLLCGPSLLQHRFAG
ncbi:hypothetical protein QNA27_08920 [Pantoea eucalypti]|uniref:hypothetical protein n=1 Tax=Pantoea eucalypti TaxID=470933 RepID=UPI0024B9A0BB|nr:hypothetical protein [Pantoea eucalypti]MDJ0473771.1 hypothetical protein [Pantoea eucalypti]